MGLTPELGYHPSAAAAAAAHVFPAAALHAAAEQKRHDFLAAMSKHSLAQKDAVSPKNADEAEKTSDDAAKNSAKISSMESLRVSSGTVLRSEKFSSYVWKKLFCLPIFYEQFDPK